MQKIGETCDGLKVYAFEVEGKTPKKIWVGTPFFDGISVYRMEYDEDYFLNIIVDEPCTNEVGSGYFGHTGLMRLTDSAQPLGKDLIDFWLYDIWNLATIPQDADCESMEQNEVTVQNYAIAG